MPGIEPGTRPYQGRMFPLAPHKQDGRHDWIRTSDFFLRREALFSAELHGDGRPPRNRTSLNPLIRRTLTTSEPAIHKMEPLDGFEPPTQGFEGLRSSAELQRQDGVVNRVRTDIFLAHNQEL